jgi:SAM-dependent methyltransferase
MSFFADANAYDRFMGRYSTLLAPGFADFAGVGPGQHVLDVGSGPGALTAELVARVGSASVAAVDPTAGFVAAVRERHPGVAAVCSGAEELPFPDDAFDAALAQLVVAFMSDPVAGLAEMRRVTRAGGVVAACMWDLAGGQTPLGPLWRAVGELASTPPRGEADFPGGSEEDLVRLFDAAGIAAVESTALVLSVEHETFDEWWEPFTLGVGPAGQYVAKLEAAAKAAVRDRCREHLGSGPITVSSRAWAARGTA